MKIGIVGAGSIGCYIGAHLIQANQELVLIGRESLGQEIREHGLSITDFTGRSFKLSPGRIQYEQDIAAISRCDAILVTVKSMDTAGVAAEIARVADPSIVISFQNGVRNAEILARELGEERVLRGMVPYNVLRKENASFHCGTSGELLIDAREEGIVNQFVDATRASGLQIETHSDLRGVLWGKLVFNLNNALNALSGLPLREELSDRSFRKFLAQMMREALTVMKLNGIKPRRLGKMIPGIAPAILSLPDFLFFRVASSMVKIDPQARSSMWEDITRGRKTEIDFLNGEVLERSAPFGYAVPYNATVVELIKKAEGAGAPPAFGADQLHQRARPA